MRWRLLLLMMVGGLGLAVLASGLIPWQSEPAVEVVTVRLAPIQETIDEQAQTRLPRTFEITMPFAGRIAPIDLDEGDRVKAGQVVAELVAEDLELRVEEARASVERLEAAIREQQDKNVEESLIDQINTYLESIDKTVEAADEQVKAGQAKLDFADRNLERKRSLAQRDAATVEELNRAETEHVEAQVAYRQNVLLASAIRSLRAAVALTPTVVRRYIDRKELQAQVLEKEKQEAEVRLKRAMLDRRRGRLTSPIDGVVLHREVSSEQMLPAGAKLLEIGALDTMQVEADILTQEAVRIEPGQPVEILGPAAGPEPIPGTVERIEPAGFTKMSALGVEQQRVKVIVKPDPQAIQKRIANDHLGVGYRIRVAIQTASRSRALVVPRSALFRNLEGQWQVFAVHDGQAEQVPVTVGLMNEELAEILDGLSTEDQVVPAPEADLADGQPVRPKLVDRY